MFLVTFAPIFCPEFTNPRSQADNSDIAGEKNGFVSELSVESYVRTKERFFPFQMSPFAPCRCVWIAGILLTDHRYGSS